MSPSPDQFDRFMVDVKAGANRKVKRLKRAGKEVRWAWFHGVLPIAATAPMRGSFCVGPTPADEQDVADVADVTLVEARKALEVGRALGMLERDDHGIEWVHDFEKVNPEPRVDNTAAERAKRYRERQRQKASVTRNGRDASRDADRDVTRADRDANAPEVEVGSNTPQSPPRGAVRFGRQIVPQTQVAVAELLLADFNRKADTGYKPFAGDGKPTEPFKRILGAVVAHPDLTAEEGQRINTVGLAEPFWEGPAQPGCVWGPNVIDRNRLKAQTAGDGRAGYSEDVKARLLR